MIESLITSSLIYNNHPVSDLNKKHKEQYLQGLGDMLSHWQNKIKQQDFVMIICAKLFWEINSPKVGHAPIK